MLTTTNIIDAFHNDPLDLNRLKDEGIIAIIHKATEGADFKDDLYDDRKKAAKDLGFLWGAFHFATSADWKDQVNFFLDTVKPEAGDLVAWDWETLEHRAPMTLEHVRDSVELIHKKLGRYPVLYGGNLLREQIGNNQDPVLKNCPLWYAFRSAPLEVPKNTWPTFTLWQYTAAEEPNSSSNPPGPLKAGGRFIDRNLFQGSDDDLRASWPFTHI